ncbi:dual OB domain-containing protein [Coleofasciculus sp. LEGE 07092]|uniref:dual OB domain-containing protein n=1 Tax=Coleofasciculus sp. LEGE 07092 TaxID=2777969 RepID=UPI003A0FC738
MYQRRTLQLVHSVSFSAKNSEFNKWRGNLQTANGQCLKDAKITDPVFVDKLNAGYQPKNNCLVTVSLSMPYQPYPEWEGEAPCWKLIAGVIEL